MDDITVSDEVRELLELYDGRKLISVKDIEDFSKAYARLRKCMEDEFIFNDEV